MSGPEFLIVVMAWTVAAASPGPATLTIAGVAMDKGRRAGIACGAGVLAGSTFWGLAAMLGMSALMLANAWLVEAMRYLGALYLGYLALKSLRAAIWPVPPKTPSPRRGLPPFVKGMLIHLTNPKPIFAWGAIFAVIVPPGSDPSALLTVLGALVAVSAVVFLGYGWLFAAGGVMAAYRKMKRGFDAVFAALFGAAAISILTARLT